MTTLWQVPGSLVYHPHRECLGLGAANARAIPDEYPGRLCLRCKARDAAEWARLHPLPAWATRKPHPHEGCQECYGGEERRAGHG